MVLSCANDFRITVAVREPFFCEKSKYMAYEVEQKFQMASEQEFSDFSQQMMKLLPSQYRGIVLPLIKEKDVYYNHPCRDFRQTDEAFRLRYRQGQGFVTFKGPKLDAQTKTRREIELPIFTYEQAESEKADGDLVKWDELLKALGFTPVGSVYKIRQKIKFWWHDYSVELSLDQLPQVGYFVEVELIAPSESELEQTRCALLQIADTLKLKQIVRKSYLDLVLNT